MNVEEARTLSDYGWWARDRLLAVAQGLSEDDFAKENGFTYRSIRGILVHALDAEATWCSRFLGEAVGPPPGDDELRSVDALRMAWALGETRMRGFLQGVTEAALRDDIIFRTRRGQEIRLPLWQLLMQVAHHGTQHRSEAAEALTMIGRSPGDLDFLTFILERNAGK
jgi:uncharacterized damage-inducible protein DinB